MLWRIVSFTEQSSDMAAQMTKNIDLKVGDTISFTNNVGYKVVMIVSRVEEKSWYVNRSRNSYGTLNDYAKFPDFKITSNQ
jgi:hypothetical protein